ncbi:hypothetical protein BROUX41_000499 [Berkeleyomyces rouxiae]|uniref:uncharacterized protein n=1 Tax=Berkeleyomyces rouxiae TaxID=2035830 RepID=UPI003B7CA86E
MSAPNLPGYYFDAEKKRYFKIEKSSNATAATKWTASTVRKRQEDDEAAAQAQRRKLAIAQHVKRSALLSDSLRGAWLAREFGPDLGECGPAGASWSQRRRAARNLSDSVGRMWGDNVRVMGRLQFNPSPHAGANGRVDAGYGNLRQMNLPCLWVGGCGSSCTGLAYTSSYQVLVNAYIPLRGGTIAQTRDPSDFRHVSGLPAHIQLPFVQSISGIERSTDNGRMFFTSTDLTNTPSLTVAQCPSADDDDHRRTQYPSAPLVQPVELQDFSLVEAPGQYSRDIWSTYSLKAGPRNSDIAASIGGTRGVLQLTTSGQLVQLYGPNPRSCKPEEAGQYPRDVFAHDFLHESPNVTIAGGSNGNLWTLDTRVKDIVNVFNHGAGVTNLSVLGNHQVLVAGFQNRMCMYDLRYTRESSTLGADSAPSFDASGPQAISVANGRRQVYSVESAATPHTVFPAYLNIARIGLGFAVSTELGVVCTASDNGTVVLHSLGSGRQLAVPVLDGVDGVAPITGMRFAELPDGTHKPSLYMGVGASIYKFSSLGDDDVEMLAEREVELERRRKLEAE